MAEIACQGCGERFLLLEGENPGAVTTCPKCGATDLLVHIQVRDTLLIGLAEQVEAKKRRNGSRRPFEEIRAGDDLSHSRGRYVHLYRKIDRDNNEYEEFVIDPVDGSVIHSCKERLSEHRNRGSAKRGRSQGKE